MTEKIIIYDPDKYIKFQPQANPLAMVLNFHRDGYLDLNPDYQRGNVWNPEQKVELIDSIFKDIEIGKFAIIEHGLRPKDGSFVLEMLDGKQRFLACYDFYVDKFKYENMFLSEMHEYDQFHFTHYIIEVVYTGNITKKQKLEYFLRLNTKGVEQDKKHIKYVKELLEKEKNDRR